MNREDRRPRWPEILFRRGGFMSMFQKRVDSLIKKELDHLKEESAKKIFKFVTYLFLFLL